METFVIVGASLAGGSAAVTLREEGFDGRVVLVGAEPEPPYERPPLSKEYLRGEAAFEKALVRPAEWYAANDVETRFGSRATAIDPAARAVELAGGERIAYDKVLVATGGRNRRLAVPGADLDGVLDLRTVHDSDRIRAEARPGRRAAVVGMGFIGSEVAASLRESGVEVAAIASGKAPLDKVLGEDFGRVVGDVHREHGVELHVEQRVAAFEGAGRVERVVTEKGTRIECDFAVVGAGIEPAVEVVEGTGVELDDGVVVDELCRTNVDGIFAAGDVARHWHPLFGRRMRPEHWDNALKHGPAAARSMLGKGEPYAPVHWFWSDQYDLNLQYAGLRAGFDELVVRGSLEKRSCVAFWLGSGRVLAALGVNRGRDVRRTLALIAARTPVEAASLRDPDVDLRTLAPTER